MASDSELDATQARAAGESSVEMIKFQLAELTRIVKGIANKMDVIQEQSADNRVWKERIENRLVEGNKTMNGLEKQIEINERKSDQQSRHAQEMAQAVEKMTEAKAKELDVSMKEKFKELSEEELSKKFVRKDTVKWILIGMTAAGASGGALVHRLLMQGFGGH